MSTLGLSIPDLIQGRATGAAQGEALGQALRERQAADVAAAPEAPTADGEAGDRTE